MSEKTNKMQPNYELSRGAYGYIALFYVITGVFFWASWYSGIDKLFIYAFQTQSIGVASGATNAEWVKQLLATGLCLLSLLGMTLYVPLREYLIDVADELTRVSWSDFTEAQKSTGVVLGLLIVTSIFLFTVDGIFMTIIKWFQNF